MCGIAGIVTAGGQMPSKEALLKMSARVAHRGPDGDGVFFDDGVGLAHRRLSIIDLSAQGAQPMRTEDGRYTIVYNGEIYNYKELRGQIGGAWKSESDTEVLLKGFEKWGTDLFAKLRGMFACAIWDTKEKRAVFARDAAGQKPLFYARGKNGDLHFASEIKALLEVVPKQVDWDAIRLFLSLQYVPAPKTGFAGISQILPGRVVTYKDGEWREEPYVQWKKILQSPRSTDSVKKIDEEVCSRLEDAVRVRLLASDVPVGAFLSGGIDSAAIVAYASKMNNRSIRTFTIGFPELGMDERPAAREIARVFHTDHHEFEARAKNVESLLDELVGHYDAPFADSSALPTWLLAKETAKEIKVVLTGDGGDESFGGYRRYRHYVNALRMRAVPFAAPLSHTMGGVLNDARFRRMADTVQACRKSPEQGYAELFAGAYFGTRLSRDVLTPEFAQNTQGADGVAWVEAFLSNIKTKNVHPLEAAMFFDLTSYLVDDLNVKMDRATMAFGLEARCPFLDRNIVEYALQMPLNNKLIHGKTKVVLRRAFKDVLPASVLGRKKQGFQVPLSSWFRSELRSTYQDRCLGAQSPLNNFMTSETLSRLLKENDGGVDHGNRLWMLVSLATWLSRV